MAELGIFRVGDVEVVLDHQLVEDVFGQVAMNRQIVLAAREPGNRPVTRHDRKTGHAGDREGFDMIGAEKQDGIRLGLVENLAELAHAVAGLIELLRVLVGRPREHVRGVARTDGSDDFTHGVLPYSLSSR